MSPAAPRAQAVGLQKSPNMDAFKAFQGLAASNYHPGVNFAAPVANSATYTSAQLGGAGR